MFVMNESKEIVLRILLIGARQIGQILLLRIHESIQSSQKL